MARARLVARRRARASAPGIGNAQGALTRPSPGSDMAHCDAGVNGSNRIFFMALRFGG
jgi:hypothetical protein